MAIYSAYLPPEHDSSLGAEQFKLLKDAKAPLALIFPPFWLAWHRLWPELAIYCAVAVAIMLLTIWQPLPPALYLSAIPGLYLLLEGNELVRKLYERKGWKFAGIVDGENLEAAEIRFLVQNPELFEKSKKPLDHRKGTSFATTPKTSPAMSLFPE